MIETIKKYDFRNRRKDWVKLGVWSPKGAFPADPFDADARDDRKTVWQCPDCGKVNALSDPYERLLCSVKRGDAEFEKANANYFVDAALEIDGPFGVSYGVALANPDFVASGNVAEAELAGRIHVDEMIACMAATQVRDYSLEWTCEGCGKVVRVDEDFASHAIGRSRSLWSATEVEDARPTHSCEGRERQYGGKDDPRWSYFDSVDFWRDDERGTFGMSVLWHDVCVPAGTEEPTFVTNVWRNRVWFDLRNRRSYWAEGIRVRGNGKGSGHATSKCRRADVLKDEGGTGTYVSGLECPETGEDIGKAFDSFVREELARNGHDAADLERLTAHGAPLLARFPWIGAKAAEAFCGGIGKRFGVMPPSDALRAMSVGKTDLFEALELVAPGMPKSKTSLRLVRENPFNAALWVAMRKLGFRKPDSWRALAERWGEAVRIERNASPRYYEDVFWFEPGYDPSETRRLSAPAEAAIWLSRGHAMDVRRAIALRGENAVRDELLKRDPELVREAFQALSEIRKATGRGFGEIGRELLGLPWDELHDRAATLARRVSKPTVEFPRGEGDRGAGGRGRRIRLHGAEGLGRAHGGRRGVPLLRRRIRRFGAERTDGHRHGEGPGRETCGVRGA